MGKKEQDTTKAKVEEEKELSMDDLEQVSGGTMVGQIETTDTTGRSETTLGNV